MYVYDSHVIIKSNCGDVAEYFAHNYKQRQLMVEITGHSHMYSIVIWTTRLCWNWHYIRAGDMDQD